MKIKAFYKNLCLFKKSAKNKKFNEFNEYYDQQQKPLKSYKQKHDEN